MNDKAKLALIRFAKVAAAGVVSAALAFVASPAFLDVIPTEFAVIAVPVLTSILSGLEKGWLRQTS